MSNTLYNKLIENYNESLNHSGINGERLAKRLAELSTIGKTEDNGVTRVGYSEEEKQAKELIISWMKEAGLKVSVDGAGNVFGRLDGKNKEAPPILSGSHVDSVPNGGNFDGPLGVLSALEVVEAWNETGYVPPVPYEVVIFSDEEGSRFKSGLTGSQAFMGKLTDEKLDELIDINGKTFDQVIESYGSNRVEYLNAHRGEKIGMFVEVHIEQGTVLEENDQPVGIVKGIAGPAFLEVTFHGKADHAGNTPMEKRNDALIAASMFITAIESLPQKVSQTAVATIGKIDVSPNGINVIAEEAKLVVDLRDINEEQRDTLLELVIDKAKEIADLRKIDVSWGMLAKIKPLPIEESIQERLANTLKRMDIKPISIPSGAAHDSMIVGEEYPVAMIFTRSKNGISHNPAEWSSLDDCVMSVHVLKNFMEDIME